MNKETRAWKDGYRFTPLELMQAGNALRAEGIQTTDENYRTMILFNRQIPTKRMMRRRSMQDDRLPISKEQIHALFDD